MTTNATGLLSKRLMCVLMCLFVGFASVMYGQIEDFEDGDDPGDDDTMFVFGSMMIIPTSINESDTVMYDAYSVELDTEEETPVSNLDSLLDRILRLVATKED